MTQPLAFGMIGCGEIAVRTSQSLLDSPLARVVHCMDVVEEVTADLAAKHEAKVTTDVDVLLGDPEVEAVVISTPHDLHEPLTVKAAAAGKHVLVEKPIACNKSSHSSSNSSGSIRVKSMGMGRLLCYPLS